MGFSNFDQEPLGTRRYEFAIYDSEEKLIEVFRTDDIQCRKIIRNFTLEKIEKLKVLNKNKYYLVEKDNSVQVDRRLEYNFTNNFIKKH